MTERHAANYSKFRTSEGRQFDEAKASQPPKLRTNLISLSKLKDYMPQIGERAKSLSQSNTRPSDYAHLALNSLKDHGTNFNLRKQAHLARANNELTLARSSGSGGTRGSRADIEVSRLEGSTAAIYNATATPPTDHQHLTQSFDQVVSRVTQQESRPTAAQKSTTVASAAAAVAAAAAAAAAAGIDSAQSAAALARTSRSPRAASVGRHSIVVVEKKQSERIQEEVELRAVRNWGAKLDQSPFLANREERKRKKIAIVDQRETNRTRDGAEGEQVPTSLLRVKRAGVKSSCGGKNNMTPGLLSGQEQDCIAREELELHHRQLLSAEPGASNGAHSDRARIVHDISTTATDQERRADCVVVDVGGGFDVARSESQLGEYSRASGSAPSTRRLSSLTTCNPSHLHTAGDLRANSSAPSTASPTSSSELANRCAGPLESPKQERDIYESAKTADLEKQAGQQQLEYPLHIRNLQHHNHQQQQYTHHQQHSISAVSPKIVDHQQFVRHYGLPSDRLVNSYHSPSLPTFMLASHHHHQLKLDHVSVSHYSPILTGSGGVGSGSSSNNADGATGEDTAAAKIAFDCATAGPSENRVARAETVTAGPPMIARAHQLQVTRSVDCLNQNYTKYTSLMTSSKSSSPNSSTSTPSPKSSAMQTLSANHSVNQLLPAGFNQSAMVAAESHLGHINQHYISTNSSGSALAQPHHQHHYAYAAHQTATLAAPSHHQHHHLGGVAPQDQAAAAAAYNHIQHHQQQHQQRQQQQQQQQQQQHGQQSHQLHQQHQQHQQQQQHQSNMTSQQSIYHQIVDSGMNVGSTHGYAAATANSNAYHGQLHGSDNQANNLISDASQNHLNNAAAACAAAAVVSQTLKTVANQHNQHHQHQYGGTINDGLTSGANLMNMATKQHQQYHPMSAALGHHQHQHFVHGTQGSMGPQQGQMQHHQQSQQHTQNLPVHHQASSIIARKYQCKMCPQVFMSKAEMKYHNQNHLREAKPYKCLQCPKAFANSSYLSQHMRIHQGLKPYTCDICTRKFTQLSHLQQHKRTHTGDKPYKCNYMNCTKQFSQLSNLQSHSRCHQLDKPYKCNSCYKCFHDEQSLLEHIPRHLESKHLKKNLCIFCGSSYQQERGLVKHFQQYHTDKTPTLVAAAIAAGTTGNTSLIASLVSSSQSKFATPSSGSTSGSISSSSSTTSSIGGNTGNNSGHNNITNVNNNTQASNMTGPSLNSTTAHATTLTNVGYHLSGGGFM